MLRLLGMVRVFFVALVLGFAFYVALIDKLNWEEGIAASVGTVLAAATAGATWRAGNLHFAPQPRWLWKLIRVPVRVVIDCGIVLAAICMKMVGRGPHGRLRVIPFRSGGPDAVDAARRALVTAGICVAPNTIVVAIDEKRDLMLVHELVPSKEPPGNGDREWPV